jgi:hypothetical protein
LRPEFGTDNARIVYQRFAMPERFALLGSPPINLVCAMPGATLSAVESVALKGSWFVPSRVHDAA